MNDAGLKASTVNAESWRILHVEDSPDDAALCSLFLKKARPGMRIDVAHTREEFTRRIQENVYDAILSDYSMGSWTGIDVLKQLRDDGRDIPFILVTGALGEERAVECIKNGVTDYILKDRLERLPFAISKSLDEKRLREERARAETHLQESEAKFRALAESLPAATFIQQGTCCCYVNHAAEQITGYTKEELEEMTFWQLVHPESRKNALGQPSQAPQNGFRYELKILTKEGEIRWLDVTLSMFTHEGALASLITAFDISNRKQAEEDVSQILSTDPLTGLSNYGRLKEVCDAELKNAERTGQQCSVLLLKLDDVHTLDAKRGDRVAEQELCRLARVLLQCRASDTPARLDGREFAVVLPNTPAEGASVMARRLAERIAMDRRGPRLSPSVATAVFPIDGKTTDKLLDAARARLRTADVHAPVPGVDDELAAQIPIT